MRVRVVCRRIAIRYVGRLSVCVTFPTVGMPLLLQRFRCSVIDGLTPLLRGIGCVVSWTTAGAETRRVYRAGGAAAESAMHRWFVGHVARLPDDTADVHQATLYPCNLALSLNRPST